MFFSPLGYVGVVDQSAEEGGNFRTDVQLLLEKENKGDVTSRWFRCHVNQEFWKWKITNLEQSQVPVIVVSPFSSSISTVEKWAVFFMITMSYYRRKDMYYWKLFKNINYREKNI